MSTRNGRTGAVSSRTRGVVRCAKGYQSPTTAAVLILIVALAVATLPEGDRPFAAKVTKWSRNDDEP